MKGHVEHDGLTGNVRLWLWHELPHGGREYIWPTEITDAGMVWTTRREAEGVLDPEIKPALEMGRGIWNAFVSAVREADHREPAGEVVYQTLAIEQGRVNKLIDAVIQQGRA